MARKRKTSSEKKSSHTNYRFRSKIEATVAADLEKEGIGFDYEPAWGKIPYIVPASKHSYLPDFYITTKTGKKIIIEVKGIWAYADRYKHLLIRKANPELDIRFVFSNSKNKIRKGSKTTYRDICEGRGKGIFKDVSWKYSDKTINKDWYYE